MGASAPLMLSADLTDLPNESLAILTNRDVLRINQDPLGRMAFRYFSNATSHIDIWRKDLVGGDVAVAIVNMGPAPFAAGFNVSLTDVGFQFNTHASVRDVFDQTDVGVYVGSYATPRAIPSHGTMLLLFSYVP